MTVSPMLLGPFKRVDCGIKPSSSLQLITVDRPRRVVFKDRRTIHGAVENVVYGKVVQLEMASSMDRHRPKLQEWWVVDVCQTFSRYRLVTNEEGCNYRAKCSTESLVLQGYAIASIGLLLGSKSLWDMLVIPTTANGMGQTFDTTSGK